MKPPGYVRHWKRKPSYGGFTVIELMVIIATLSMLVCVLIPSIIRERRKETCRNNLRQIGLAFKTFAVDSSDAFSTRVPSANHGSQDLIASGQVYVHFRALSNELANAQILVCPADRRKIPAKRFDLGFSDANVSYFVGVDAVDTNPYAFLSGDRNLAVQDMPLKPGLFVLRTNAALSWTKAIHHSCGFVAFADGTAHFFDPSNLMVAVRQQATDTNRLAIP